MPPAVAARASHDSSFGQSSNRSMTTSKSKTDVPRVAVTDVAWDAWQKRSPPPLTKRSVDALKKQGIEAQELIFRPREFFSGEQGNLAPEHVDRIFMYHEAKRKELLALAIKAREKILAAEGGDESKPGAHEGSRTVAAETTTSASKGRSGSVFSMTQSVEHISSVEKEEQKVADQRRRQKQYVEQMLLYEIRMQQVQAEMLDKIEADRRKDEERRQAEAEAQRQLTEQRRREELERDQKFKDQMAQKKALAVEMFEEERRRLQAEAEAEKRRKKEALQLQKERQAKQEEFRQGIEAKFQEQQARVEAMHQRLQQKDAARREAVAQQRAEAAAEAAERQRRKMERVRTARAQLEQIHAERKRRFDEREAKENEQMARFEASQSQWKAEARRRAEERSRELEQAMARNEENLERRRQMILDKEAQALEAMAKANAERRQELERQMVERQLKLADRLYNVERQRRQDEYRKEKITEKIEYGAWRTSFMNSQKVSLEDLRRRNRDAAAAMKEAIGESMHQMKITKRFELPTVFRESEIESPELKEILEERERVKHGSTNRSSRTGSQSPPRGAEGRSLSPIRDEEEVAAYPPMGTSASTGAIHEGASPQRAPPEAGMRRSQSEAPPKQPKGSQSRLVAPPPVRVSVERRPFSDPPLGPVPGTAGAPGYQGQVSHAAYSTYGADGSPGGIPFQPQHGGSRELAKTWNIYSWPRQQIEQLRRKSKEERARAKRKGKRGPRQLDLENDNTYFIEPTAEGGEDSGGEGVEGVEGVEGEGAEVVDALTHRRREEERRQRDEEEQRYAEARAYLDEREAEIGREMAAAEAEAAAAEAELRGGPNAALLSGFGPYEGDEEPRPPAAAGAAGAAGAAPGAKPAGQAPAQGPKKKGPPPPVKAGTSGVPPLAGKQGKPHSNLSPYYEEQSTPSSVLPQDDEYEAVPFEAFESDQDYTRWSETASRESQQGRAAGLDGTDPGPGQAPVEGHVQITPLPSVVLTPAGPEASPAKGHADRPHAAKQRRAAPKRAASFTAAGSHDEGAGAGKSWRQSSKQKLLEMVSEEGSDGGGAGPSGGEEAAAGPAEGEFRPKSAPGKFFEATLAPKPPRVGRRSSQKGKEAELGVARVRDSVFAGGAGAPPRARSSSTSEADDPKLKEVRRSLESLTEGMEAISRKASFIAGPDAEAPAAAAAAAMASDEPATSTARNAAAAAEAAESVVEEAARRLSLEARL